MIDIQVGIPLLGGYEIVLPLHILIAGVLLVVFFMTLAYVKGCIDEQRWLEKNKDNDQDS